MTEYDNTNRGVLFINREKKSEKSPDFSGSLDVGGTQYNLAAWKKVSKKGASFLSVSISLKPEIEQRVPATAPAKIMGDPFDDEIPF